MTKATSKRLRWLTLAAASCLAIAAIPIVGCSTQSKNNKNFKDSIADGGTVCDDCNSGCGETNGQCNPTTLMCACDQPPSFSPGADQSSGCFTGCCALADPGDPTLGWSCFAGAPGAGWCLKDDDCGDPSYYCKLDTQNGCAGNVCTPRCGYSTDADGGQVSNGQVWDPNEMACVCQSGSAWNDSTQMCECTGGAELDPFGICTCPPDRIWNSSTNNCDCLIGEQYNDADCACPTGQFSNGYTCECSNGGDITNNCECTGGTVLIDDGTGTGGTVCGCPSGELQIPGTDQCDCPPGSGRAPDGTCQPICLTSGDCPAGQICVGGSCTGGCGTTGCPPGETCDPYSNQCAPSCTPASCPAGDSCNPVTGKCTPSPCGFGCPAGSTCVAGSCTPVACAGSGAGFGCPPGTYCLGGFCSPTCGTDANCPAGFVCSAGACVLGPPLCGGQPNDPLAILEAQNRGLSPDALGIGCVCGNACSGVQSPLCLEAPVKFAADGYWASYCRFCYSGGRLAPCFQVRDKFMQANNIKAQ